VSQWSAPEVPASEALAPYDLRCEYRTAPLGIDSRTPRLSWRLTSPRRGDTQTAFRVTVSAAGAPVWDTGWIESDAVHVDYAGAPLVSGASYSWQVAVRDASGEDRPVATSTFETGILHSDEWAASWIEHDPENDPLTDPPVDSDEPRGERTARLASLQYLRRTVELSQPVSRARIFITAHGLYQLQINGRRIAEDELTPGWTDYRFRLAYQTYDVTDALQEGENALGAILAEGWYAGCVGWDTRHHGQHYGPRSQLFAQLVIEHPDGSRTVVATDGSWRESPGPLRYADLLMGESYDARRELGAWSSPGYDDSSWGPVAVAGSDTSTLFAARTEPVRVIEDIAAVSVVPRGDGRFIVDFGQNFAGRIRLTVRDAPEGARIRLRHGEMLESDGGLYTENLRTADATDYYVTGGAPVETFEPAFTVHGFRYAEVDGYPGELSTADIFGRAMHSDTPVAGDFSCSDAGVRQLMSNIRWGQRGNFVSVPTDCPQRDERLGWTADAQIFLPTACYNADVLTFFDNWLDDLAGAQTDEGALPDVAPHLMTKRNGTPAWADAATIVPWHLYRVYGDERMLRRSLPMMTRWVDFVHHNNPDLIWRRRVGSHYGDWLQVGVCTSRDVLATAYFARSAELTAAAAKALGEDDIARRYSELRQKIAAAFVAEFVSADGRITGDTQTGYLLPLAFDLLPADLVPLAVEHLVADLEKRDRSITTGFAGVSLICPVLARFGHAELAYDLLHDDRYPSWGYSIKHGATTIWERWDGWTEEQGFGPVAMNSFNHYSLGSVGAWLYSDVAGIDQAADSVGFRQLVVRPRPGGRLDSAEASYDAPTGRITSSWSTHDGRLTLEVRVPPGAVATVHVPTNDPASVREADRSLADGGISAGAPIDGAVPCEVGSGRYTFTATLAPLTG
jgi:alpha-L-rhamnosidase